MRLVSVIDRLSNHYPQPFAAPVPDAEQVEVFTLQDSIPYRFRLRNAEPGWWMVIPTSKSRAQLGEPAQPCDTLAYLDQLPRFYVICCFRLAEKTWLVVPYNTSDAAQRGWPDGEPRAMHLVRHAVRPFDVAVARSLAGTMLYESVNDRLAASSTSELIQDHFQQREPVAVFFSSNWQNALGILGQRRQEFEAEAARRAVEGRRCTTEGELRWQLEFMGANLNAWSESGEGYEVSWSHDGRAHSMRLRRDKRIESAGICLDNTDSQHNLSSIVAVMEEARRLGRSDL